MAITSNQGAATIVGSVDVNIDKANDSILVYGSDDGGTTKRVLKTDSAGVLQTSGGGGGGGGSSSNFTDPFPSSGTAAGFTDGTNMQSAMVFDGDTGAGTEYVLGLNLRKRASGGTVEAGTSSDPLRVDPTGSTTQPVSASSLPLPTGAATAAKQDTGNTSLASIDGKITAVNTGAVVVSSSALPTGAATSAKQDTGNTSLASIDGKITAVNTGAVTISSALPAGNNNIGDVDVASLPATTNAGSTAKTFDYDTGAGTDTVTTFGIALPASGGAVAGGTSTNPIRTDPTGTTTQPISASSLPLPTGASTAANQSTANASLASIDGKITAVDTGAVVISSGSVTANAGTNLNTSALALESGGNLASIKTNTDNLNLSQGSSTSGQKGALIQAAVTTAAPSYTNAQTSPLSLTTAGALRVDSSGSTVTVTDSRPATASLTNVASSASSVSILSSNSSRRVATLFNDSTQLLYLKFGTTASSTSYTVQIAAGAYYEFPQPCYTGAVDGIWASANGNARVTELT